MRVADGSGRSEALYFLAGRPELAWGWPAGAPFPLAAGPDGSIAVDMASIGVTEISSVAVGVAAIRVGSRGTAAERDDKG